VAPDRIQGDYEPFAAGSWISEVIVANLQISSSSAVITFTLSHGGFDCAVYYRTAQDTDSLAAADWTEINTGDTIAIQNYYQFKLEITGMRSWAEDDAGDAQDFTAYAVDAAPDDYLSYAGEGPDDLTYLEDVEILGEFNGTIFYIPGNFSYLNGSISQILSAVESGNNRGSGGPITVTADGIFLASMDGKLDAIIRGNEESRPESRLQGLADLARGFWPPLLIMAIIGILALKGWKRRHRSQEKRKKRKEREKNTQGDEW